VIKRYTGNWTGAVPEENDDGTFVLYTDHLKDKEEDLNALTNKLLVGAIKGDGVTDNTALIQRYLDNRGNKQ